MGPRILTWLLVMLCSAASACGEGTADLTPQSYADLCEACHGLEGAGLREYAASQTYETFSRWVRGVGREGPMPAFPVDRLPEAELVDLYRYLRARD